MSDAPAREKENILGEIPIKVLFVDDEENILKALRRLLIDEEDMEVFTASSGEEGLKILESEPDIGVIVSDQRMPGLSGVDFLEKAKKIAPHSVRIVLTGYADVHAAVDAINRGGAYRYVSKPWKDEELLQIIRDAASRYRLIVENRRLIHIINQQNRELKSWNEKLEARVKEQTEELQRKNKELETLADRLQRTFESTIDAFAGLIELRNAFVRDHSRKVTQLALLLAEKAGMSGKDLETLRVGALLHDVGKIGIPDLMLQKDPEEYSPEEVEEYRKHPVRGQTAIDSVEELREAGIIIRGHHENYDGSGFPDGLKGSKIPLGARIVRLCDFVDNHFSRCQGKNALEQTAAKVKEGKFTLFDPDLVSAAVDLIPRVYAEFTPDTDMVEVEVSPDQLKPGMILARDVTSGTGLLLLRKGTPLDSTKIASLRRYYTLDPSRSGIFVFTKK